MVLFVETETAEPPAAVVLVATVSLGVTVEVELMWVLLSGETVTGCVVMVTEEPFAVPCSVWFGEVVVMVTLGVVVLLFVVVVFRDPCVAAVVLLVGLGLVFMWGLVDADMLTKMELVSLLVV